MGDSQYYPIGFTFDTLIRLLLVGLDMSKASFDDDELFSEATEDIQTEIAESLTAARTVIPSQVELVEHETETVNDSLESLDSAVDIEAIEAAITDVKKAFLLGQRADAFESEYATETETAISELEEIVATLQAIDSATAELQDALSAYTGDAQSVSGSDDSDSESGEATEDSEDDDTDESAEASTGEDGTDSSDAEEQEQLEVSDGSGDS